MKSNRWYVFSIYYPKWWRMSLHSCNVTLIYPWRQRGFTVVADILWPQDTSRWFFSKTQKIPHGVVFIRRTMFMNSKLSNAPPLLSSYCMQYIVISSSISSRYCNTAASISIRTLLSMRRLSAVHCKEHETVPEKYCGRGPFVLFDCEVLVSSVMIHNETGPESILYIIAHHRRRLGPVSI